MPDANAVRRSDSAPNHSIALAMSVAVQTEGDTTQPYQLQYHWLHKVTDAELLAAGFVDACRIRDNKFASGVDLRTAGLIHNRNEQSVSKKGARECVIGALDWQKQT